MLEMFKEKKNSIGAILLLLIPFLYVINIYQSSSFPIKTSKKENPSTVMISSFPVKIEELKLPEFNTAVVTEFTSTSGFGDLNFNKSLLSILKLAPHSFFPGKNIYFLTNFCKAP